MTPLFSGASDHDIDAEVARLVSSGVRIPPQPRLVMKILEVLAHGEFNLRAVCDLIGEDAGLTAMLYKLTRSAAFASTRRQHSIESIVVQLGARQAALLVQSYGLTVSMEGDARVLEQFWARSTGIAELAATVAVLRRDVCRLSPEQAYMAGIFHDCGVPVLMQRFPAYCQAIGLDGLARKWTDVRAEDQVFHSDHCSIGYLLARHWRLPEFVAQAILHHHDANLPATNAVLPLVAVLQLAVELFSRERGVPNPDWVHFKALVLEELALHPEEMEEFCDQVLDVCHGTGV